MHIFYSLHKLRIPDRIFLAMIYEIWKFSRFKMAARYSNIFLAYK